MTSQDASNNEPSFSEEIQHMMFGLGDSQSPLLSTALLVETVTKQQLTLLLGKASEIADSRESTNIELQDIIFVLRKNKVKLSRLLHYLGLKDTNFGIPRMQDIDPSKSLLLKRQPPNRKEECLEFLSSIGIENITELKAEDEVKLQRLVRADEVSQSVNDKAYQDFHKSRKGSFYGTILNEVKLLEWLKSSAKEDVIRLQKDTVDVLIYLAKETVAQLVDLALLVRQDAMAVPGDVFSNATINPLPTTIYDLYGNNRNQIEGPDPISPDEIREVLRRYWTIFFCPFSTFAVNTYNPENERLLFC